MSQIEVPAEILRLSVDDRLELVAKIWDSISQDGLPPLSQAARELVDRRIEAADRNPQSRVPAAQVFDELERKD